MVYQLMSAKHFAKFLSIKPLPEDVAQGSHENTKVSISTDPTALITFTAQVTMGADLYAQWSKAKYKLEWDESAPFSS
jgi:hypothetical protein